MPEVGAGLSAEWIRDSFIKLTSLCERIMTKQEDQDRRIEKIETKVDELSAKPGKRWDGLITAIIGTFVGIILGIYFGVK